MPPFTPQWGYGLVTSRYIGIYLKVVEGGVSSKYKHETEENNKITKQQILPSNKITHTHTSSGTAVSENEK